MTSRDEDAEAGTDAGAVPTGPTLMTAARRAEIESWVEFRRGAEACEPTFEAVLGVAGLLGLGGPPAPARDPAHVGATRVMTELLSHIAALDAALDASWAGARGRLLHGLYHIRDMECPTDHDERTLECPARAAREAIDDRPCSICAAHAGGGRARDAEES